MKLLIAVAFSLVLFQSCKTQQNGQSLASKDNNKVTIEKLEVLKNQRHFGLSGGPCMGPCPDFEFSFIADSIVLLESKNNLLTPGVYRCVLSDEQTKDLQKLLMLDWEKFQTNYSTTLKDLPTNIFYYRTNEGAERSITMEGLEPDKLKNLKEELLQRIKTYEWQEL